MTVVRFKPREDSGERPVRGTLGHPPSPRISMAQVTGLALLAAACLAGGMVVLFSDQAGLAGLALLVALTLTGAGLIYAFAQPAPASYRRRERLKSLIVDHLGDAVCVTDRSGIIVYANETYARAFRAGDGSVMTPDAILSGLNETAARLYRLMRASGEGESLSLPMIAGPMAEGNSFARSLTVCVSPLKSSRALTLWRLMAMDSEAEAHAGEGEVKVLPMRRDQSPTLSSVLDSEGRGGTGAVPSVEIPPLPEADPDGLLAFFRDAPIGVAVLSPLGDIRAANPALAFMAGASGPLDGRDLQSLVLEADRKDVTQALEALQKGERPAPFDLRFLGPDKRTGQLVLARLSAPASGGADPAHSSGPAAVAYVLDTTEQKAIELQFAQSQKMQAVGQLAGGVAHDFNNLLTVVLGFTELLLQRHKPGDASFADLMQIKNNAARAARLVGQLLAFSRRQVLQPKVFYADDLLNELSDMLTRVLTERVRLSTHFGREVWPIKVDESQFSNMVMNLALNAKDAMPEGGTVTLSTSNVTLPETLRTEQVEVPAGDYVLIEVSDTGTGIPKEIMGKIFEPFFTTKGQGKGTGLGLSMVYGFVKQSGGFIFPESEAGKGTTFRIYLPRYLGPEQSVAASEDSERHPHRDLTGRGTILLVEDEDAVRSFAARALSMRGYQVVEANGGEAALEIVKAREGAIELLITDVVMPNMEGPTLAKELKRLKPDLKIIFISGYAEDAFRRADENPEAIQFLPKPFSLKQLAAKVKDVLDGP